MNFADAKAQAVAGHSVRRSTWAATDYVAWDRGRLWLYVNGRGEAYREPPQDRAAEDWSIVEP